MHNAFDFKKFEKRLLESLQRNEKFIQILAEEETAADQAKKMGLTSMGFGRWGKDDKVTHKTTDGKLEPIKPDEQEKDKEKEKQKGQSQKAKGAPEQDQKAKGGDAGKQHKNPEKQKAQDAMPKAQLSGKPLRDVPQEQLAPVVTRIDDLARMGKEAKARGEKAPNYNLCDVSIPGTNLFCGGHKGIPRDEMPQFKGMPEPGSRADKLPKDPRTGEVDTEAMFQEMLDQAGIKVSEPQEVAADQLRSTQSELVGVKVAEMSKVLEQGPGSPGYEAITAPIYVSRDGYVLDGHHRWAAIVAHNSSHPDSQIPLQVRVIDEDIVPLVERANQFASDVGIKPKAADTAPAGEKPKEEPKAPEEKAKEEPKAPEEKPKEEPKAPEEKPKEEPKKGFARRTLDRIRTWGRETREEARKFFGTDSQSGGSSERRGLVRSIRDKAVGAVKASLKSLAHFPSAVKHAASGVRSLLTGKKPTEEEVRGMIHVGVTLLTTSIFGLAGGHAAHGLSSFAAHVVQQFLPHVVKETILIQGARALAFAGDEDTTDEKMMEKYLDLLLQKLEEMDIPDEVIEKAIMSYNEKGEK